MQCLYDQHILRGQKSLRVGKEISNLDRYPKAGMGNPWHAYRTWHASSFLWHASENGPFVFLIGHLRT